MKPSNVSIKKTPKPHNRTKIKTNLVCADDSICFLVSSGVIFDQIPSHLLSSSLEVLQLLFFLSIGSHPAGLILLILSNSVQEKSMLKRNWVVKPFNSVSVEHRKLRKNLNRYTLLSCICPQRDWRNQIKDRFVQLLNSRVLIYMVRQILNLKQFD